MRTVIRLTEQDIKVIQYALSWNREDDTVQVKRRLPLTRRKWNKIVKDCANGELCEIITLDNSERR